MQDSAGGMVVSDIRILSDKDSLPHGYCFIAEHLEPSEHTHLYLFSRMHHIHSLLTYRVIVCPEATVSKKKRVCVRIVPVGSVETAVLDIKLTAKSKMMLQHYTFLGYIQIHGLLSLACFIKAFS